MTMEPNDTTPKATRREALSRGIAGALTLTGLGLIEKSALAFAVEPTPGTTQGPYWVDEMLNRSDIRADPSNGAVALGFPLRLTVNVSQLDAAGKATPLPGAIVDIWHCNALGVYSDEASENTLGMKFLRGYQVTDARGGVKFVTVYPGWYSGRTPHIHVRTRVYNAATGAVTYNQVTQLFFDEAATNQVYTQAPYNQHPGRDTTNATDMIYTADDDADHVEDGVELMLTMAGKGTYALATYNIYLNLANGTGNGDGGGAPPGGGGNPPGGGGGPPPGGGGPPPGGGGPPPGGGS